MTDIYPKNILKARHKSLVVARVAVLTFFVVMMTSITNLSHANPTSDTKLGAAEDVVKELADCAALFDVFPAAGSGSNYMNAAINFSYKEGGATSVSDAQQRVDRFYDQPKKFWRDVKNSNAKEGRMTFRKKMQKCKTLEDIVSTYK